MIPPKILQMPQMHLKNLFLLFKLFFHDMFSIGFQNVQKRKGIMMKSVLTIPYKHAIIYPYR